MRNIPVSKTSRRQRALACALCLGALAPVTTGAAPAKALTPTASCAVSLIAESTRVGEAAYRTPEEAPARPASRPPLVFEPVAGDTRAFAASCDGHRIVLDPEGVRIASPGKTANAPGAASPLLRFEGGNPSPQVEGLDEAGWRSNYFLGAEPSKWRTDVRAYSRVRYTSIYDGIDAIFYGNDGALEFDFAVAPGADPDAIRLRFDGASLVDIAPSGDLTLIIPEGEVTFQAPVLYQGTAGARTPVAGRYTLRPDGEVGFEIADYDRSRPLVIDPVVRFANIPKGNAIDAGGMTAVDAQGNLYLLGTTYSPNFVTEGGHDETPNGESDLFVLKYDPSGENLLYATFVGGRGEDGGSGINTYGLGIAVDNAGNIVIVSTTNSTDFPAVNALQPTFGGGPFDAVVVKLDPSGGTLLFSTYLGGSGDDEATTCAVDPDGFVYLCGFTNSTDFPTVNALQANSGGGYDGMVMKIAPDGSSIVFSTYLGGMATERALSVEVDAAGCVYVAGFTRSPDFPTTSGPFQVYAGTSSAYVSKFAPDGSAFVYSVYVGGTGGEIGTAVEVDASGAAYVLMYTSSTDLPVTQGAYQPALAGGIDSAVVKLGPDGASIVYATYVGGTGTDYGFGLAVNGSGEAYIVGLTDSTDLNLVNRIAGSKTAPRQGDGFVVKLDATGQSVRYATLFGGAGFEQPFSVTLIGPRRIVVGGQTESKRFPVATSPRTPGAKASNVFLLAIDDAGN